ncbi:MFS transporter [Actinoplanes sp. TFC3]|uniref:MFS transporter n=1 Tax=Actinoplanes sp. TFC3 TaxID=1710355 RepID=UPI0009EA39A3|nr:MFS transporter [Actinoplanes sp. TFC3]
MTPNRALAVLCTAALMIVLDSTIVAVAVPVIQNDLGFSPAGVAWIVNGYLIGFAGFLLLAGRLGDLIGARTVFLAGLATFTAASALCGLAPTAALLVTGRFIQGVGGALASAVIFGIIVRLFPGPASQARAIGVYSFTQASGAAVGFVAGGLLTEAAGWPWIFLVNLPIGAVALIAALRVIPRDAGLGLSEGLDIPGAVLITIGLSAGVFAIVDSRLALGAAAVLLVLGFLVRERFAHKPLVPLRVLRNSRLLITCAAMVLIFATGMGFQFIMALYAQHALGLDAIGTGLAFLPTPIVIGLMSLLVAPRTTARFGVRPVLIAGLIFLAAGLLLLARMPAAATYGTGILPPLTIMGLGIGVVIPAIIMLVMSEVAPADTGLVSGLANTAQQAGGALGLSVLAVVAAQVPASEVGGYARAFLVAAGFVLGAVLLALAGGRRRTGPCQPEPVNVLLTDGRGADLGGPPATGGDPAGAGQAR